MRRWSSFAASVVLQDLPIALRQLAVRAVERLIHRDVRRGKRRAQIVRERVDDVANHVAAFGELVLLPRDLLVSLAQLREEPRLLQRHRRPARRTRAASSRASPTNGFASVADAIENVLAEPLGRDRASPRHRSHRALRALAVPSRSLRVTRKTSSASAGARDQRRDLRRQRPPLHGNVRVAATHTKDERTSERRLAHDQHRLRRAEQLDRLAQ